MHSKNFIELIISNVARDIALHHSGVITDLNGDQFIGDNYDDLWKKERLIIDNSQTEDERKRKIIECLKRYNQIHFSEEGSFVIRINPYACIDYTNQIEEDDDYFYWIKELAKIKKETNHREKRILPILEETSWNNIYNIAGIKKASEKKKFKKWCEKTGIIKNIDKDGKSLFYMNPMFQNQDCYINLFTIAVFREDLSKTNSFHPMVYELLDNN